MNRRFDPWEATTLCVPVGVAIWWLLYLGARALARL